MNHIELPSPAMMSAKARAAEITAILAAAIQRTHLEKTENRERLTLAFRPTSAYIQLLLTQENCHERK